MVHIGPSRASSILKCFPNNIPVVLVRAFCTYVRPILEHCAPVWSPHHIDLDDKKEMFDVVLLKEIMVYQIYPMKTVYIL
jgi:hypothetical protein